MTTLLATMLTKSSSFGRVKQNFIIIIALYCKLLVLKASNVGHLLVPRVR